MKNKFLLLPVLLAGLLAGCGTQPGPDPTPTDIKVTSVSLGETTKLIEVGESFQITATVKPDNATNKNVTWKSSDSGIAEYNAGYVTGKDVGNATITVVTEDQNKTATCDVVVYKKGELIHVESVALSDESITLSVNEEKTLNVSVLPENASNKNVNWVSDDSAIATVENGVIKAISEGITTISVSSEDGNITASCEIIISGTVDPHKDEKTFTYVPLEDSAFAKGTGINVTKNPIVRDNFTFTFKQNEGRNNPIYTYKKNGATGTFRLYPLNSMEISSEKTIKKIELTFESTLDTSTIGISTNVGSFSTNTWKGETNDVIFNVAAADNGCRAISEISITYIDKISPVDPIDIGVKTIKEVKDYIEANPFALNSHLCGVNEGVKVTIQGLALAKISLIKTAKAFGLDVSEPSKIIIGDATDAIGVATKTGDGTLFNKINNYQMKDTSYYKITGVISVYLGQPEILCTSFEWLKDTHSGVDLDKISKKSVSLEEFYTEAENVNYNCAGHGYGDIVTVTGLTCYSVERDGQGKTFYNFTDGTLNLRVNAYNISLASVGSTYNVTGIISLLNLSPIIVAFKMENTQETPVNLTEFYKSADTLSITDLRKIHGSQDDTDTRYPEVIESYSAISKVEGYLCVVEENGKLYVGVSDDYKGANLITGKDNAKANYGVALIKNDNFWNTTEEQLALFNPYYEDYLCEDAKVTLYYVNRQLGYKQNKTMWEILLIPQSIPVPVED